jgi:hypothetical protein
MGQVLRRGNNRREKPGLTPGHNEYSGLPITSSLRLRHEARFSSRREESRRDPDLHLLVVVLDAT